MGCRNDRDVCVQWVGGKYMTGGSGITKGDRNDFGGGDVRQV